MGILGKMFAPPSEIYDAMLDNYRRSGLQAELLPKDNPETIGGNPSIKVNDRNVNLVQVKLSRGMMQAGRGGGFGPSLGGKSQTVTNPTFEFDHIVKGQTTRNLDDLKVEVKTETRGTFSKSLVDLRWEGGRLAEKLNGDPELKENMMKIGATEFKVEPDSEHNCIIVEYDGKVKNVVETKGGLFHETTKTRFENLPSIDVFNLCDRIAGHVKGLLAGER